MHQLLLNRNSQIVDWTVHGQLRLKLVLFLFHFDIAITTYLHEQDTFLDFYNVLVD